MPLYSDLGIYYAPHLTTPSYYSSPFLGPSARSSSSLGLGLMPIPRLLPSRVTPCYSPLLASIPESSNYGAGRLGVPSLDRAASPRAPARFLPPKPVHIDTSDIDVSSSRFGSRLDRVPVAAATDPGRQGTIKRGRTVVRLHTKKLKENPALDSRRRMTPGEKLVQKFLILDKAEEEAKAARRKRLEEMEERERVEAEIAKLQAMAAKKAAAEGDAADAPPDGTFAQDPQMPPPTQNFPTIQGLTENAALDILLSATEEDDDEEQVQGGDIVRTESTGTVKKRKIKEKDGTVKETKKKTKKKELESSQSPAEDSPTGEEAIEKSTLQRRNTIRFRRNSDVEGFPEIESVPGSRRSSFDQSPSSRRSSVDSTGDEIPLASEKKSTVKRRKGPKTKFIAEVSVDTTTTAEPRSPKFVVDEVKVEQSPASPRGAPKKFRYEVIVEDVEGESAPVRRGKASEVKQAEVVAKKKKPKAAAEKPQADRKDKIGSKVTTEINKEKKELTPKSFQKSRLEPAEETKAQVAVSKTEEIAGKKILQKEKVTQETTTPKSVAEERNKEAKHKEVQNSVIETSGNKIQDKKEKEIAQKDKKHSEELKIPKVYPKDIQNCIVAAEKAKPPLLAEILPKLEEAKSGKLIIEKTKKHQADPSPIPGTPSEMQDSGINFWAFLNGSDEEKEFKKPVLRKEEHLDQPVKDKVEKTKKIKTKPALQLKIQNKCMPAENTTKVEEKENKSKILEIPQSKVNDKIDMKTVEEKTGKLSQISENLPKKSSVDISPEIKATVQKEPHSTFLKNSLEPEKTPKITADETDSVTSKSPSQPDASKAAHKEELSAKTPEEKVPKWKALAKDRTKTPDTPDTAGSAAKFALTAKNVADVSPATCKDNEALKSKEKEPIMTPILQKKPGNDETVKDASSPSATSKFPNKLEKTKTKELLKVTPDKATDLATVPGTPDKKLPAKWKALGKQPPSIPASPKEPIGVLKSPDLLQEKKTDVNLKSKAPQTPLETSLKTEESPKTISLTADSSVSDKSSSPEKTPAVIDVTSQTPKIINESQEKGKILIGTQQKQSPSAEEPTKSLLKEEDRKEAKATGKISTPEQDSRSLPKWKAKASNDKDVSLKNTKQTSLDKTMLTDTVTPEVKSEKAVTLESTEDVKTRKATNSETPISKTEPKTPPDSDKLPKKLPVKKVAAKALEKELSSEQDKLSSKTIQEKEHIKIPEQSVDSVTHKAQKEMDLKNNEKQKKIPVSIPKFMEQKSKDEEKAARLPFGKKGKLPEQKSQDKNVAEKEALASAQKQNTFSSLTGKSDEKREPLLGKEKTPETKSKGTEEDKCELPTPTKKPVQAVPKTKDDVKKEPLKKGAKLIAQKSKEETPETTATNKKLDKTVSEKSKDDSEPTSPIKKFGKVVPQIHKDKEIPEPLSPAKKGAKLVAQKSKEGEKSELPSPQNKDAKPKTQKSENAEKKAGPAAPAKKGAKLPAQKSKEEGEEKAPASPAAAPPSALPSPAVAAPAPPESGNDADSESSSSEDEGDTTPRASSSSCSSSDSGFDSRPSSVPDCDVNCHRKCEKLMPHLCGVNQKLIVEALTLLKRVPSTASEASSRETGSSSPSLLSCSPSLDPYSEDTPLVRSATGRSTPPAHSLPRYRKYTVDDFQFLKLLGKGSFGKVLLAELRGTDRYYAVKCLKKDVVLEDDDVECTLIERKVLALGTKHPYLCHLFCTFQTESHLLFVMEYLNGGDLMFHIQQSGRFQEHRARFYAAEIVCGLKFLHKKGIVYRDLKLDNILLDFEGHVRIADFGMCKLQIFLDRTADTFCGTPDYMAPEIIKGLKYNQCVDWWSFGVLVFEMLVGVSPFSGCDEDELFWSICNEQPQYPRFLSREAHSLLCSLLEKDAQKRLGTPESPKGDVPDHVFFRNVDWSAMEQRELEPPFRPRVKHPLDTQYFDAAFTAERAELTPVDASILQSMDQAQFQGFSYTNPNATD